ncbi:MAG: S-adenosylmethionine:tRNA ribosyltransferase-isomerase, partial [Polyangiales bacterium]
MRVSELDFELPEELIAQQALVERSASRLLLVDAQKGHAHHQVMDLPGLLEPSLFVVNETRVIPARLRGSKSTGGRCELLLVEAMSSVGDDVRWRCLGTANKPLKPGTSMYFGELRATIETRAAGGILEVRFDASAGDFDELLSANGEMPLPPYIARDVTPEDAERYQTVFARLPGAVAAPTAGLHFDEALLGAMEAAGHQIARVALHVGPGTFRPVQCETLEEHPMHAERYYISQEAADAVMKAKSEERPVVAVGTTVVRTLEAAADAGGLRVGEGRTDLFIRPGFEPQIVDHLFTNFHLPRSTLLALVMAFGGIDTIRDAYKAAVDARYRFFSYGDAMLIRTGGKQ